MSARSRARSALEVAAYRLGVAIATRLPLRVTQGLAAAGASAFFRLARRRASLALANLRIAFPELDEAQRREIARQSFVHLAWNLLDVMRSTRWSNEEVRRHVAMEGLDHLRAALAQGRGAFALMCHIGNFEVVTLVGPLYGIPTAAVSRPLGNERLFEELVQNRARRGTRVIDRRHGARAMLRAIADGYVLGVLNDQYSRRRRGVFVPFFGVRCSTSAGLATLALRTSAPVLPVMVSRDGPDHHRIEIQAPLEPTPRSGDLAKDIELATARYNAVLEQMIRRHPEQYMWSQRRYRHSPDLERTPY